MKKIFLISCILLLIVSCSQDRYDSYNPYVPDINVNLVINLNLPSYSILSYPNNSILETSQGYNGVIVYHSPVGFVAYEATCSNHPITSGSALSLHGEIAKCNHCSREYFLINGQPVSDNETSEYFLKAYRVEDHSPILTIRNF